MDAPADVETVVIELQEVDELPTGGSAELVLGEITYVTEPVTHAVNIPVRFTGCGSADVGAYWNGAWIKTNPPQIDITMWKDPGATCQAIQSFNYQVDIAPLMEAEPQFTVNIYVDDRLIGSVEVGAAE